MPLQRNVYTIANQINTKMSALKQKRHHRVCTLEAVHQTDINEERREKCTLIPPIAWQDQCLRDRKDQMK